jgi:hypothetical protein
MARTPNEEILRKLDEVEDWSALIEQMLAYAVKLAIYRYRWQPGTVLPKGDDIQDIVFRTVTKLYSGERTWDPDRVPLQVWLRNNIRSEMNNLFDSSFTTSGKLREVPIEPSDEEDYDQEPDYIERGEFRLADDNPEAILIKKEDRRERLELTDSLYKAIEGDELLENIYYQILDGCERKPRILAERLGVSREDIYNALRRLDRRVFEIALR